MGASQHSHFWLCITAVQVHCAPTENLEKAPLGWRGWSSSTASTTLNECAATWQVSGATSSSVGYLCSHDRQAWTLLCSAHCLWLPFSLHSDCLPRENKAPPEGRQTENDETRWMIKHPWIYWCITSRGGFIKVSYLWVLPEQPLAQIDNYRLIYNHTYALYILIDWLFTQRLIYSFCRRYRKLQMSYFPL